MRLRKREEPRVMTPEEVERRRKLARDIRAAMWDGASREEVVEVMELALRQMGIGRL